jgi:hypothetical protein
MKLNVREKCLLMELLHWEREDAKGESSYRQFLRNLIKKFKLTTEERKKERKLYGKCKNI